MSKTSGHDMDNLGQPAPVLPDHLTYDEPETREYINGWNDCRQALLESLRKPT